MGVDPVGSVLARPDELNVLKEGEGTIYKVEGTGYDFVRFLSLASLSHSTQLTVYHLLPSSRSQVPAVLSHSSITHWLKTTDHESFTTCKRLIRTEGLLVGGSSGASVNAALRWLKSGEGWEAVGGRKGKNVVVVLPDSYVSASLHLSDLFSLIREAYAGMHILVAETDALPLLFHLFSFSPRSLRNYITSSWLSDPSTDPIPVSHGHVKPPAGVSDDGEEVRSGLATPP